MHRILFAVLLVMTTAPVEAVTYSVPPENTAAFFANLPEDATLVRFDAAAAYSCSSDIVLPPRPLLIIDGAGATLHLGPDSRGFTCAVNDQKAAVARLTSRYIIRDFAVILGGRKAVDLQATLGSEVRNVKCVRQTEAAVDLRFCLMARLEHVFVTNPTGRGIVVRHGDWPGATAFNSQSNSTVLEQCRVYCATATTDAFAVLNSGGVRMADCVSEGAPCDHDLFLSAVTDGDEASFAGNTVVKSFTLANFHVEHAARIASIHVNMPSKASVSLGNVYWNGPQKAPVIRYMMGQLNLQDIGWWHESFRIVTHLSAPRLTVQRCHSLLNVGEKNERTDRQAGVLHLDTSLVGSTQLKLNYVVVRDKAM
ncbi:MAG TPA: hypothetical protein PKE21_02955 [Flavobacteriales bacterium]|nr:hypothetical protein [Flavobacteriales bacterium]HMR26415.1 hypothetical protein [Flavobacteriales bacterium]